ncbi:hypothetical protein EYF80_015011 [Liparis tanakae]|uniref:Uncharacterized protein n=1 Tax=Liparis tanakae TaxID=230148 RepID=A0A4Z2ICA1_9TELE|nr:hypothetical protein EYF80_015011 [Liparis tanakae]
MPMKREAAVSHRHVPYRAERAGMVIVLLTSSNRMCLCHSRLALLRRPVLPFLPPSLPPSVRPFLLQVGSPLHIAGIITTAPRWASRALTSER